MWGRYISDANESCTPRTFRAADEAMAMHNSEVFDLQAEINIQHEAIAEQLKYRKEDQKQITELLSVLGQLIDITDGDKFPFNLHEANCVYNKIKETTK